MCNVHVSSIERNETESVSDKRYFVGTLQNARAWDKPMAWIRVTGRALHFRNDSGADVTVISHDDFKRLPNTCLSKSDLSLLGPEKRPLDVMGKMNSTLSYGDTDIVQDVYVSRTLTQPLLGWPAIKRMGLFSHLSNVEAVERYRLMFTALFIGLGKLEHECHIELTPDAQPHCLFAPRRVPLPLQEAVNAELQRM